jgi:TonB family protein
MSTTILNSSGRTTHLGIGLDAERRKSTTSDAWKQAIGTNNRASARLDVLPGGKRRWDLLGASAIAQLLILAFFVSLPLFFPDQLKTVLSYDIMPLSNPITEIPVAPAPPPPPKIKPRAIQPKPKPEIIPEPPKAVKLVAPKFNQPLALKPRVVETKQPDFKPALEEAKLETNSELPRRPREEVKTGNISSGSAAPATLNLPVHQVQTGGFGDPNGVPGPGDPNKRTNVNGRGSPLLPGGPGYGNGTGGDKGARGTVASTGFGNGVAVPPPSGSGKRGTVQAGGFSDATAATEAPEKKKQVASDNATTTVDILEKPHPVYTAEGRKLKIEGNVVLDLVFLASGQVHVNGVVSSLGHGLDESAIEAAKQIRFKPAKREGQPVDFPARVRIEFRLAY